MTGSALVRTGVLIVDASLARRLYERGQLRELRNTARLDDPELYTLLRQLAALGYADVTDQRTSTDLPRASKENFTPQEAGRILGVGAAQVRKLIRANRLTAHQVGRNYMITADALNDYRRATGTQENR